MADESDDDLYGDSDTKDEQTKNAKKEDDDSSGDEPMDEGQDSGDDDDDDEDSESDVEIIIDKPAPVPKQTLIQPQESKAIKIEAPPQPSTTPSQAAKATAAGPPTTGGTVPQLLPGTAYPAQRTSTIDVNGNPVYAPLGKEIQSVDMEADMAEEQKIWRRPGEDQSDYFNYGFDEFTWEMYRHRQVTMAQTLQQQKNDMVNMQQMMGAMPSMPAMPGPGQSNAPAGAPSGPSGGAGGMPPGGMNEAAQMEMMFQQMASQGMDPSQMDFASFMQMAGPAMGGFGGPGGQQGAGFQQGNHGGGGGGGGGGRGGRGGRGRGW